MIAAVVLAAGAATRFGSPKQLLLLEDVLTRVRAGGVEEIVVVAGAYELQASAPVVRCPDWERGPGASLRCGLRALPDEAEAAVVTLADGPDLAPAAVRRVIDTWRAHGDDVLAASYGGERGHPVLLARAAWSDVPDEGARALAPMLVPCDDLGPPGDVDRPDDLPERFRRDYASAMPLDVPESHRDLLQAPVAALATIGDDGIPEVTAVWFLSVDGELKISLNETRKKTHNLLVRPECNLFVLDTANPMRYLEVRARAELELDDDHVLRDAVGRKYGVDLADFDPPGQRRYAVTLRPVRVRAVDMRAG